MSLALTPIRHAGSLALALVLLLATAVNSAQASSVRLDPGVEEALAARSELRVLVLLDPPASKQAASPRQRLDALFAQLPQLQDRIERRFESFAGFAARIDAAALDALHKQGESMRIGLDEGGSGHLLQSVPLAQVTPLHLSGFDGASRKLAIIDSGMRGDHLSFAGRIIDEACFCTTCCPNGQATQLGVGSAEDNHGHGTNVGGIAAGANGVSGVPRGVASAASIVAIKVLDQNNGFCCSSDVIAAYDWLRINHPDATVVNASLGTNARFPADCDASATFTQAFATVLNGLRSQGTLATVSSGNNGSSIDMQAPACIASALAVGAVYDANVGSQTFGSVCTAATTSADQVTCFSNLSPTTDLLAPGAPVTAAGRGSSTATSTFSGTSMAAPMTAGCIAAIKQAVPNATPDQIEAALEASPTRLLRAPMTQDYPRLDCADAVLRLLPEGIFADGFESL